MKVSGQTLGSSCPTYKFEELKGFICQKCGLFSNRRAELGRTWMFPLDSKPYPRNHVPALP